MPTQPLPVLVAAFAAGIAVSGTWLLPEAPLLLASLGAFLVAVLALRAAPRWVAPSLCLLAFVAGAVWEARDRAAHPDVLKPWLGRRVEVVGTVQEEPIPRAAGWSHRLRVTSLRHGEAVTAVEARLLLRTGPEVHLPAGSLVRAAGFLRPLTGTRNFGDFDYARYAARDHLTASLTARDPFVRRLADDGARPDRRLALDLRARLAAVHRAALPPDDAALLNSVVFGSRATPVSEAIDRAFRDAGITHLLVASGAQVSLLVGLFLLLGRFVLLPRWAAVLITLGGAWLYGLMAGEGPSILRAGILAAAVAAADALGRETEPRSLLALTALGVLGLDPGALFDIGFHLSFTAVWGLVTLQPWISRALPPSRIGYLLAASAAAQLAVTPILAYHFCQAAPVAVLTNLVAVPLAGMLLVLGTATSLVGQVWTGAAFLLDGGNLVLLRLLRAVAEGAAALPGGHFWIVPPTALQVVLSYALLMLLPRLRFRHLTAIATDRRATLMAAAVLAAYAGASWLAPPAPLRVTFLDVGQGDATLIQAPSGAALLVDGGGSARGDFDVGEKTLLPALLRRGVHRLDTVVLTHPHSDHAGGLVAVLRHLPVGALLDPDLAPDAPEMAELLGLAGRRGVPRLRAAAGASWWLDDHVRVSILHPPQARLSGTRDDANNNSVVLRLDYGRTRFLLAGDIGADAEERLLRSGGDLRAQVLKVPHHGSAGSNSEAFLAGVAPRVAVISVGAGNLYGLPARAALGRLGGVGAWTLRTDEEGAVEVVSDGENLTIRTARAAYHCGKVR